MTKEERELLIVVAEMCFAMYIDVIAKQHIRTGVPIEQARQNYDAKTISITENLSRLIDILQSTEKTALPPEVPLSGQEEGAFGKYPYPHQ